MISESKPQQANCASIKNSLIVFATAFGSLVVWYISHPHTLIPAFNDQINAVAYTVQQRWESPTDQRRNPKSSIQDVQQIAGITGAVRTYTVSGGIKDFIQQAEKAGLEIIAGAWTGVDSKTDGKELSALIQVGRSQHNIKRLLVGNEVLLRNNLSPSQVQKYIEEVRIKTKKPTSVAEPWHIWLANPTLADSADFLAVHILPYWEGISVEQAVPYIDQRLKQLQNTYPGKPILLAEVGWPSAGDSRGDAKASKTNQIFFVRTFAAYAKKHNIDYVLLEAYDQPWKAHIEGQVGSHWGLFDAHRNPKWPLAGSPIYKNLYWLPWALLASFFATVAQFIYIRQWPQIKVWKAVLIGVCFQAWAVGLIWPYMALTNHYLTQLGLIVWITLSVSQLILFLLLATDLVEFVNVLWHRPHRCPTSQIITKDIETYFVSIHVPCSGEPFEIVSQTLTGLSRLDYPNYEVIVISNNYQSPGRWKPIQKLCLHLGPKFHFVHQDHCPGYKAGALNLAETLTNVRAEIIAVVDCDYVVEPNWLRSLMPIFKSPDIAIVQSPQDHVASSENKFQKKCFWEYAGFFQVGMIQRNEANAIIQHGTMTLIRRSALAQVGGWSEWCITEDAELGLRLLAAGWNSLYVPNSFGRGLLPSDFNAYKTQRFRWTYGAMQILRRFGPELLGLRKSRLRMPQKYHFLAGWMPWLADAVGFIFTLAAGVWTVTMIIFPDQFGPPIELFLIPVLVVFVLRQLRDWILYAVRVKCSLRNSLYAAIAGQSLKYTIARAVLTSVFKKNMPFQKTRKQWSFLSPFQALMTSVTETSMFLAISCILVGFCLHCDLSDTTNILWIFILIIQTMPYLTSFLMACSDALSRRRMPPNQTGIAQIELPTHTK